MAIINNFMEPEENYIPEEEIIPHKKININKIPKKSILLILLFLFLTFIIFLFSILFFSYFSSVNRPLLPTPSPKPKDSILISPTISKKLTKWSTSSAVIKTEEELSDFNKNLDSLDLNEVTLSFPALDFNINFDMPR